MTFTFACKNSLKLDWVLPHRYFPRLRQLIDFIVDVITEVWNVSFVCPEVQEIQDRPWWWLHNHFAGLATGGNDLHLHVLTEWRNPQAMTCFYNEQVIVALHTAKLGTFVEQMLHCRVSPSGVMRKFECRCLHFLRLSILISILFTLLSLCLRQHPIRVVRSIGKVVFIEKNLHVLYLVLTWLWNALGVLGNFKNNFSG